MSVGEALVWCVGIGCGTLLLALTILILAMRSDDKNSG